MAWGRALCVQEESGEKVGCVGKIESMVQHDGLRDEGKAVKSGVAPRFLP